MAKQIFAFSFLAALFGAPSVSAQTTEFTYQGKLSDSGTPSATYNFEFRLCAAENILPDFPDKKERKIMKHGKITTIFSIIIFTTANISAQIGGNFAITQSVVAGGGGQNSAGGTFAVDGTIGQSVAGGRIGNTSFIVTSGFWNFSPLAPTAANVSLGGRIMTPDGSGIRNIQVMLTAPDGQTRTAQTGSFGYYRFEGVPVGETYVISIFPRRFTFSQPTQVVAVLDAVADINFIADEL